MIEFDNLHKAFDGKVVLDGISNRFLPGKCNLIIGASGEGKSVLLKCIVGIIQPDTGDVYFDGRNLWEAKKNELKEIRRELGMLFQGSALLDDKTVEQNVAFPLEMMTQMSLSERLDRVNFCLQRVGLEGVNKKMPSEISGGMKKRVGIARAIVMNPKYLFCDEPNSGLDPTTSVKIDHLIEEITYEYKTTTVVVTHDMNSVLGIGDYIMYLRKGKKAWEGDKHNILESDNPNIQQFVFANPVMRNLRK